MTPDQVVFRNPNIVQVQPLREWIRRECPTGRGGFVAEDLDLSILRFSKLENRYYRDDGRFLDIEVKWGSLWIGHAQRRHFGLRHRLMRIGDPEQQFYQGFYIIQWHEGTAAKEQWQHIESNYNSCDNTIFDDYFNKVYVTINSQYALTLGREFSGIEVPKLTDFLLGRIAIPSIELIPDVDFSMLEDEAQYLQRIAERVTDEPLHS